MIELKPLTESEVKHHFPKDILDLPNEYANKIRSCAGKSESGNIFYKLKIGCGTSWAILEDTIYNPLTSIKCIYESPDIYKGKKWEDMFIRNKKTSLSRLKELYKGIKSEEINLLDFDKEGLEEILKKLKNLMAVIVFDNRYNQSFTKSYEDLRETYKKFRKSKDFYPETNKEDAKTLIELLEK